MDDCTREWPRTSAVSTGLFSRVQDLSQLCWVGNNYLYGPSSRGSLRGLPHTHRQTPRVNTDYQTRWQLALNVWRDTDSWGVNVGVDSICLNDFYMFATDAVELMWRPGLIMSAAQRRCFWPCGPHTRAKSQSQKNKNTSDSVRKSKVKQKPIGWPRSDFFFGQRFVCFDCCPTCFLTFIWHCFGLVWVISLFRLFCDFLFWHDLFDLFRVVSILFTSFLTFDFLCDFVGTCSSCFLSLTFQ